MTKDKKPPTVSVVLIAILSGGDEDKNPGDVISVDADEAARLISVGAAKEHAPLK
jgi:hypothetical protein